MIIVYVVGVVILSLIYGYFMEDTAASKTLTGIAAVLTWPIVALMVIGAVVDALVKAVRA